MSYIIIVIIVLALLGVFIFLQRLSQKEKERRQLESKAKRILTRFEEIWDIIDSASEYINSPDIFDALLAYYGYQIKQRDLLTNPDDTQTYLSKIDTFKGKLNSIQIKHDLVSDTEINKTKRIFSQASKLLRAAHKKRMIDSQACNSMRKSLRTVH